MRSSLFPGILVVIVVLGCEGESGPTNPVVTVSISPSVASVEIGHAQQFTAVVSGKANQDVNWMVEGGATKGSISTSGLYTAPASVPSPNMIRVRATSQADPTKSGTAIVAINSPSVTVSVHPGSVTLRILQMQQFQATVTGAADPSVTWVVDGGAANGSIEPSGLYSAPGTVPTPALITVRAVSSADPIRFGTAAITVIGEGPEPGGFARVPSGGFVLGDGEVYCAMTTYQVALTEEFFLGQTEVTNREYLEMVQWAYDQGYVTATETSAIDAMGSTQELLDLDGDGSEIEFSDGVFRIRDAGHGINPDHPVKQVTWYGAAAYCDWWSLKEGLPQAYDHTTWLCNGGDPYRARGYRLPTEAEWEYAAQYDDERLYPWGNEPATCDRANYGGCNDGWTEPVGTQALGPEKVIGGDGLFDMAGNVWEWCNDWWQCDPNPARQDPPGPTSGTARVLKGGSYWQTQPEDILRCSTRTWSQFGVSRFLGFRVARTVDP